MSMMMLDPALTAGWEPGTPVTDTLLRRFLVNWRDTVESLGSSLGRRTLQRDDLVAVDVGRPGFIVNSATLHAPLYPEAVDEAATALDDFYGFSAGVGTGKVLLFSPWPTPDLRPHGWSLVGHLPLMLRPAGGDAPPPPPGLRIEEVRDESGLRAFEEATVRGFGLSDIEALGPGALFGTALVKEERARLWVGWEGGRPVRAAGTFVARGINDVFNVATVPEARRRGVRAWRIRRCRRFSSRPTKDASSTSSLDTWPCSASPCGCGTVPSNRAIRRSVTDTRGRDHGIATDDRARA